MPSDFEYELSEHDPKEEEEEEELKTRLKMEEDMMETQGKQGMQLEFQIKTKKSCPSFSVWFLRILLYL